MYRASVFRALATIALAKIAQVPIPTNPNIVVKIRSRKRSASGCKGVRHPCLVAAVTASGHAVGLITNEGEELL
jgi:hypothetical protein